MSKEIQEVVEQLGTKFEDFKAKHDERLDEIEEEVIQLAKGAKRPAAGTRSKGSEQQQKNALTVFIKTGDDSALAELQAKSMSVGVDADGGYAVPEYLDREVRVWSTKHLQSSALLAPSIPRGRATRRL